MSQKSKSVYSSQLQLIASSIRSLLTNSAIYTQLNMETLERMTNMPQVALIYSCLVVQVTFSLPLCQHLGAYSAKHNGSKC